MHLEISFDVVKCIPKTFSAQKMLQKSLHYLPDELHYLIITHNGCHTFYGVSLPMYTLFSVAKMCALAFFVSTYMCLLSRTCQRIFT